jgi:hypothetical protein
MSDLFSNTRFVAFRSELEKLGRHLKILWSANSGCITVKGKKFKYDDVVCFAVYGGKVRSGTVIVKDYGEDGGFGLYTEPDSDSTYSGDANDIIGLANYDHDAKEKWVSVSPGMRLKVKA